MTRGADNPSEARTPLPTGETEEIKGIRLHLAIGAVLLLKHP